MMLWAPTPYLEAGKVKETPPQRQRKGICRFSQSKRRMANASMVNEKARTTEPRSSVAEVVSVVPANMEVLTPIVKSDVTEGIGRPNGAVQLILTEIGLVEISKTPNHRFISIHRPPPFMVAQSDIVQTAFHR